MESRISLPLSCGRDRTVEIHMESGTNGEMALVLPGLRYGAERPLLRTVIDGFKARGCGIAQVNFTYTEDAAFMAADDATQFAQIASDGGDIVEECLRSKDYRRIWLVGKSLGTLSMAGALLQGGYRRDRVFGIWLTPSLMGTPLLDQLLGQGHASLVVMGSEDPSNRPELIDPILHAPHLELRIVEGADHGFTHPDGAKASDKAVEEAARAVRDWVSTICQSVSRKS